MRVIFRPVISQAHRCYLLSGDFFGNPAVYTKNKIRGFPSTPHDEFGFFMFTLLKFLLREQGGLIPLMKSDRILFVYLGKSKRCANILRFMRGMINCIGIDIIFKQLRIEMFYETFEWVAIQESFWIVLFGLSNDFVI